MRWKAGAWKGIKTRDQFPNDDAALKLLILALRNAGVRWHRPAAAATQLAIL